MKYFEDTIQAIRSQATTEMNASLGQDTPVPNDLKLGRTPDEHVTSLHIVLPGTGGFFDSLSPTHITIGRSQILHLSLCCIYHLGAVPIKLDVTY